MSEVNYSDTVIIPVLQKKYQDMMNSNLVLEVNLLVEQAKNRDLQQKLDNAMTKIENFGKKNGKKKEEALDGSTY